MKKLIAGNWKMNGTVTAARALMDAITAGLGNNPALSENCDFLVCPPALHIHAVKESIAQSGASISLGAQNCSKMENGACTGDIAAAMVKDSGCQYVILGHSERRYYHGETDGDVAEKAARAHENGLISLICVGEKENEREMERQETVVGLQLDKVLSPSATPENTVIAYEPVWAVGTGKVATPEDVAAMHHFIRKKLQEKLADFARLRILYGGSVKPDNAKDLLALPDVDGALIGGASLDSEQYLGIAKAA